MGPLHHARDAVAMMPYRYNNGIRIMQPPGYVIRDLEMVHETRIVPVDGRPPRYPLKNDPADDWWEYACHEGNRTIGDDVRASRAERAKARQQEGR